MKEECFVSIFNNYILNFDLMNNPIHYENYKWEILEKFRQGFDTEAEDFAGMLKKLGRETGDLMDSPNHYAFQALRCFALQEPEAVRNMFRNLFADDHGDLTLRQRKILDFIAESERLRQKYMPDNPWFVNDQSSVMSYLFFHAPEDNFLYSPLSALAFADCIGFSHDWHFAGDFRLNTYYRMCRELTKRIAESPDFLSKIPDRSAMTDCPVYADRSYHLLASDFILCFLTYDLFEGITYEPHTMNHSREQLIEKRRQAEALCSDLTEAEENMAQLDAAKDYFYPLFSIGKEIRHRMFGLGIVRDLDDNSATIFFPKKNVEKKFSILASAAGGFITIDKPGYKEKVKQYKHLIEREGEITQHLCFARKQMAPYTQFLD